MLAIIVASHGNFAKGILQSASMIFGEQEKVETVTFEPTEGPDDLLAKYNAALGKFDKDDQVLFLVDLWGGSPFNAASRIVAEHLDTMALMTGLNLPMLIEAYTVRDQDLSQVVPHLEETAKAGVKHLELQEDAGDDDDLL
ncbi:PTS system, mannose-specific IIA component [Secundilactobacillus oryzae JCM 18671]|uniref:PTS system, mannose-specific IIA component n=1 Tax=Secundilactobacillus oryzae JCM 18671 TaxID=1291743 RepID=A0A081BJE3_9LACO|nr:PTS sugar transporter subunit IIA [Secundilactobacillus oryzae]GAK48161.1 PTS system, mannose-specific IIA component [Secundilactobacillus oryzae JCM 18671]